MRYNELREIVDNTNTIDELKILFAEYMETTGNARKRYKDIDAEIEELRAEQKRIDNDHDCFMSDMEPYIKMRIGEIVCSAS